MTSPHYDLPTAPAQPPGPDFEHFLRKLPRDRTERSPMRAGCLFDGSQTLLFFLTGRDRTGLVARVARAIHEFDLTINIDGIAVFPVDGYVGMLFTLSRRSAHVQENRRQLMDLAGRLEGLTASPLVGKQIPPLRQVKVAVEAPDVPGTLLRFAQKLTDDDVNISKLESLTWDNDPLGADRDPRCLLTFQLELSGPTGTYRDDLTRAFAAVDPSVSVVFDGEADAAALRGVAAPHVVEPAWRRRAA